MSAPPGFNANDSLLPDPGANSAPIHVMRGGGRGGGSVKRMFGMFPGGPLGYLSPEIQDGFEKEVEEFKLPYHTPSTHHIKQVIPVLKPQQRIYLKNILQVYSTVATTAEKANWQKTVANTENVIREGQYLIETGTGKVPNENQPLVLASMVEEDPVNFSAGVVAGKPSAMRANYTRKLPHFFNAVVGKKKMRISGKTPYYATKRYGAEMNSAKQAAPITAAAAMNWGATAAPAKKPGFFSRIKSWFSRKKGGRRHPGTKRRN